MYEYIAIKTMCLSGVEYRAGEIVDVGFLTPRQIRLLVDSNKILMRPMPRKAVSKANAV